MEAPCVCQKTGGRDVRRRTVAPDVASDATPLAATLTRQSSPLSLDSLAVATVLVAHIYSFLSLVDHIWLSRTAQRLNEVSRLPAASPERMVLNQLPPPGIERRFHPRGLAVVGDDGYVPLDVVLLAKRFSALEFLSLTNQTELRDLSRLRHLQTLCCRRVHQPVPLPLPERLTAIDYDCYTAEDATRLFRDPSSRQLRSFRVQWMRDSTPQLFPDRLPDSVCNAMLRGGASLTDLALSIDLTQGQIDAIARALGDRLTSLGLWRICSDAVPPPSPPPSLYDAQSGIVVDSDINSDDAGDTLVGREFATLATLSVSGWRAAVLVSRRAPALQSLAINCDMAELGARSESRETRHRQDYWSANNDDGDGGDGASVTLSPPSADKRLRHATLTSLKVRTYANRTQFRLATRLPALRHLSIVTHTEDQTVSAPLRGQTSPGALRLDLEIESFEIDTRSARVAPALPPSDTLTTLVLQLNPTHKIRVGFAIPYPALTHVTLSGFDPAPVLASLGACARLHTIRLDWVTMSLDEIPARLGPILRRLLVALPYLQRLHLGPHVRANLAELRRVAARLREVVDSHPCVVSCDSSLTFEA